MSDWLPATVVRLSECESTNDEAQRLANEGAAHGTVVIADKQSAGRGRRGRHWVSDGDNLYMSVVLRPGMALVEVASVTLAAGIAVAEAVNSFAGAASLKWPNDVLIDGKKVAGILCEMSSQRGQIESLILGVGVNVNQREFPPSIRDIATSVAVALGESIALGDFEERLLETMGHWLKQFFEQGVSAVIARWQELAAFLGQEIRVGELQGIHRGLDPRGALVIEDRSGHHHSVNAGEVLLS